MMSNLFNLLTLLGQEFFVKKHRPILNTPEEAFEYLHNVYDPYDVVKIEKFYIICMDKNNIVNSTHLLASGDDRKVYVDLLKFAELLIEEKPKKIIATHNHPVGSTQSSIEDKVLTLALDNICTNGEVILLDHIIYSRNNYHSFLQQYDKTLTYNQP